MKSADDIVEYIINGGCPSTVNWEYISIEAYNGFTTLGETIVTSIIKEDLKDYKGVYTETYSFKEGVIENFLESTPINFNIQNKFGETPFLLMHKYKMESLLDMTSYLFVETCSYSEIFDRQTSDRKYWCYEERLKNVFEKAKPYLKDMFFEAQDPFHIEISFDENFYPGENSLEVLTNKNSNSELINFTLFVQESGDGLRTMCNTYALNEVDKVVEIIKLYCDKKLWV